ncbi:hypothetical protein D0862_13726 [Hortaea werneckii]|uniref:RING-type domain-containing protein n=1 Tax=Hortaea werneckii TaxID=91943 RepID=A0A3M7EIS5_HORWE|nr:hypothetical protein D0862_13726 [Hortaea werneckii]
MGGSPGHFIRTGLVPLHYQPVGELCDLCKNAYESERIAVQIPCGHIGCKTCMAGWIGGGHEHCPFCRMRLVFNPPTSVAQRLAKESPVLVRDALGRAVADFKACLVRGAVERVDSNINFKPSEVLEAGKTFALFIRGHVGLPTSMCGVAIQMSVVDAHILAVANIAPAYAFEVGKPYTSVQLRHLPMILAAIHATLRALVRIIISGGLDSPGWLINSLKASVDARLNKQGASLESSGFEGQEAEGTAIDLDTILQYIVFVLHRCLINKPLPPVPSSAG